MQTTSQPQSRVAVVILNYNGRKYLEKFLPLVLRYTADSQIVVADNFSTDDSVQYVAAHFPEVRLICLPENKGFCGGYNAALSQIDTPYYVLLNSDVEVTPNWLEPLVALLESHPDIAACQPKIKSFAEPEFFEYAGAAGGFIDFFGYPFSRGRLFDSLEKDLGQYNDCIEIFWATGACMCVRAELYHRFGGLDEKFFAHMEEIDLCWRLKNEGYKIAYVGNSEVFHVGGGTLNKLSPRKSFFNFRNGLFLMCRNLPTLLLFPLIFVRLVLDGIAGLRFLFKGQYAHTQAIVLAHFSFYRHLPYLLKSRKGRKKRWDFIEIYRGSVVWDYFIRKKEVFAKLNLHPNILKIKELI